MDVDPACVETNYRRASAEDEALLLPLVVDLASPSPAIGWANRERMSLVDRGPADAVLALALIHHLAIGNNVPFRDLAEFVSKIGRWLVIEFVPKEDPMVQAMLATRPDVFPNYSQQVFEDEFGSRFAIERSEPLPDSPRSLYLMRSK
jgi:hypothetical protein